MSNEPISQEHTLERFLKAGWKLLKQKEGIYFVLSKEGKVRAIIKSGHMIHLTSLEGWDKDLEITGWVNRNVEIEKKRSKKDERKI